MGFRSIIEAADLEAVSKAAELPPDLVLLDIAVPKLSGIDAAARIRLHAPSIESSLRFAEHRF